MTEPLMALCTSMKMQPIRDLVTKVATTNTTVLLRGESGTGKEVVARAIHKASPRAGKQFLKVNCAALPGELLESELFGHEKGAFTGAYRQKPGKFEAAHQGTLLLDEIGEMPLRLQAKLLHVLQDGEFSRVGGEKVIGTDVRLIAATNRDLEAALRAHQWREEIPLLVEHFKRKFNAQFARSVDIPQDTIRAFMEYHWPGNLRELENNIKRIVVLGSARTVHQEIVANLNTRGGARAGAPTTVAVTANPDAPVSLKDIARQAARDAERVAIKEVLDRVHWNRAKAARLLQISYKALLYKIVQCGLVVQETEPEKQKEVIAS